MGLKRGEQGDGSTQGWGESMSKATETGREKAHRTRKELASLVREDV